MPSYRNEDTFERLVYESFCVHAVNIRSLAIFCKYCIALWLDFDQCELARASPMMFVLKNLFHTPHTRILLAIFRSHVLQKCGFSMLACSFCKRDSGLFFRLPSHFYTLSAHLGLHFLAYGTWRFIWSLLFICSMSLQMYKKMRLPGEFLATHSTFQNEFFFGIMRSHMITKTPRRIRFSAYWTTENRSNVNEKKSSEFSSRGNSRLITNIWRSFCFQEQLVVLFAHVSLLSFSNYFDGLSQILHSN